MSYCDDQSSSELSCNREEIGQHRALLQDYEYVLLFFPYEYEQLVIILKGLKRTLWPDERSAPEAVFSCSRKDTTSSKASESVATTWLMLSSLLSPFTVHLCILHGPNR